MRQLFLPVCLCLVTWSSATGSNPGLTLDEYSRASRASSAGEAIRHHETASAVIAIPTDAVAAESETHIPGVAEVATLVPDLAAEYPVPSGVVINNGEPAGIPLPPRPKPVVERSEDEICHALTAAAQQNDVPAPFFIRLLFQESRFRPEVVSSAGAQGIAQFMPDTASLMGLDNPYDPVQAIPASARLLGKLVRQFGNLGLAAAAYNAGPKRVADWLAAKGKSKLPDETQGYVKTITGKPVEHWSTASVRHPGQKLQEDAPCQQAAGLLAWNGPDELPLPVASPLRANAQVAEKKAADKRAADKDSGEMKSVEKKAADKKATEKTAADKAEAEAKPAVKKEPVKRERVAQR
ncbi:lytic transglycosylase domain-containing protein [Undibacter mobilis]|uniref:Lytic transglycosylase domain-containing protein n=1 Tax=Undibacter mobilis TaxID=2292256 RepID=A0A371B9L0_9BRAD|nr:lytic transglycosylase domain-containing protein [Undibacter mobilis]RDV04268.1 lytic transglycosylase domain-containing protein [Undibacter mobilis]